MSDDRQAATRERDVFDERPERAGTFTSRFIDAAIRRLLEYRPAVPGQPPALLVTIGFGLALLSLSHVAASTEPVGVAAIEVVLPGTCSITVLALARWTTQIERRREKHASAVIFSVVFMAIAMTTVGIILLTQLPRSVGSSDYRFAVTTTLAIGAVVGTPTGFIFDEMIARQEALDTEYRKTKRLNRHLQVVNRVMRHNVRNELTVALGGLESIDADCETSDDWLGRSRRALERLHDHTEKLLKIESLEETAQRRTTVDLVTYVEGFFQTLDLEGRDVDIETQFPAEATVHAHPLVGTAVLEAIENALVHNSHDDLRVTIRIVEAEEHFDVVVVDTGSGIPDAELEALQLDEEQPLKHGQGVGLWLCKWVTEASNGSLSFESNAPQGTVVRFRFPRAH